VLFALAVLVLNIFLQQAVALDVITYIVLEGK
jgi:hypothetical protein